MPWYFFHLQNDAYLTDKEGMEFPDLEAARTYAIANVLELVAADVTRTGALR
jgi:hypothetical protein